MHNSKGSAKSKAKKGKGLVLIDLSVGQKSPIEFRLERKEDHNLMVQKKYLKGSEHHELESKTGGRLASRDLIPELDRVGSLTLDAHDGLMIKHKPPGSATVNILGNGCNEVSYGNNNFYNEDKIMSFQNDRMRSIGFEDFEPKSSNKRRMQSADVNNKKNYVQGFVVEKHSGKSKGRNTRPHAGEVGKAQGTPGFFKKSAGVIQEIKITDRGEKLDLKVSGGEGLDLFKVSDDLEQNPEITNPGVMVEEDTSQGFLSETYKEAKANVQLLSSTMKSKFDQTSQSFSNHTNCITSAIH